VSDPGFFKGYWVVTWNCPLCCDYCFRDTSPASMAAELPLDDKKALLAHLYRALGFRMLALSGGEPTSIGARPPEDFLELLRFLRRFKSTVPAKNLELELYTNGVYLDERLVYALAGVVDTVAMTVDSSQAAFLERIGRSPRQHGDHFRRVADRCALLGERGVEVKLHSVVGALNHRSIPDQVAANQAALTSAGAHIGRWKFYQYMSYDDPLKDGTHAISSQAFQQSAARIRQALGAEAPALHFKDNTEMRESFFNILHDGRGQFMRPGDTFSTSRRTRDLRAYPSMARFFAESGVSEQLYRKYHEIHP